MIKDEIKIDNLIQLQSKVFVADPCFTKQDEGSGYTETLNNVLSGSYEPLVNLDREFNRIASVILIHTDYLDTYENQKQELVSTQIDVESGQCGVYNYDYFVEQERSDDDVNSRKFDIDFSVGLVDRNQPIDETVIDEYGVDVAEKLLKGKTNFRTFKGAYKSALRLREMCDKYEVVITPMYNTLDEDGIPSFGTGENCLSILPDGSVIPLSEFFTN